MSNLDITIMKVRFVMENTSNSENKRLEYSQWVKYLKVAAIISFITGFIALLYFPIDYSKVSSKEFSVHFDHKNGLQDLANVLLGTTGLMWSLTATFLFIYTIFQTREQIANQQTEIKNQVKEMQTSNETFIKQYELAVSQQYKTTFFSLLANHAKLLSSLNFEDKHGYKGLSELANDSKEILDEYFESIEIGVFLKVEDTQGFPNFDYVDSMDSLTAIADDLYTIVKYIDEFLHEDLYYQILNNFLPISEKYALGLYCNFHLNEKTAFFNTHKFNYLAYYDPHKRPFSIDNYFPTIDFSFNEAAQGFVENNIDGRFTFKIEKIHDEFSGKLVLSAISLAVIENEAAQLIVFSQIITPNLEINKEQEYDGLNELVVRFCEEQRKWHKVKFRITFHFDYGGKEYIIKKEFEYERHVAPDGALYTMP